MQQGEQIAEDVSPGKCTVPIPAPCKVTWLWMKSWATLTLQTQALLAESQSTQVPGVPGMEGGSPKSFNIM
jgi:hypothetical protein